jgi:hypothetical protein
MFVLCLLKDITASEEERLLLKDITARIMHLLCC